MTTVTVNRFNLPAGLALGSAMLADVYTSAWLLQRGGTEMNPFMVDIAPHPGLFIGVKVLTCLLVAPLLVVLHRIRPWLVPAALAFMATLYLPIIVNNIGVMISIDPL